MVDQQSNPKQYLAIFESELRFIADNAAAWNGSETGGDLVGYFTHQGRAVVQLATPPGPGARHEVTHFAQDFDYFNRVMGWLMEEFGLQYLGDWHSHHSLGLDHPSGGDKARIRSVALKNGYPTMQEIIVTCSSNAFGCKPVGERRQEPDLGGNEVVLRSRGASTTRRPRPGELLVSELDEISVHAFHYHDAGNGANQRCPIRLLPGISPIRQALLRCDFLTDSDRTSRWLEFPFNRIRFDEVEEMSEEAPEASADALSELTQQLDQLSEHVCNKPEVVERDGLVVITLPLLTGDRVAAVYRRDRLYTPIAAQLFMARGARPLDLLLEMAPGTRRIRIVDIVDCATRCAVRASVDSYDSNRNEANSRDQACGDPLEE